MRRRTPGRRDSPSRVALGAGLALPILLAAPLFAEAPNAGAADRPPGGIQEEAVPPAGESPPAEAADEERLRSIRSQIEELRARLVAGEDEAGGLLESLDEMDLTLAVLRREAALLEREVAAATRAEEAARIAAQAARARAAAAETALREWLVQLYKAGPAPTARLALVVSSAEGVAIAARAAERLAVAESRRVGRLREERTRSEETVRAHEAALARLGSLGAELDQRRAAIAGARAGKEDLLAGIRERQESGREALAALVRVETDLQALLQTLGGGAAGATPSHGLTRFKGLLNWPVPGPVALGFGNVRHPRFDTQVPHPGIEIACPPGETVRALFDGRVVFSSWFRGYGQMIVIDHGDEYLSIYGQLGERLVEAGQEIRRDEPIARSGEEGTFGVTGLYLEVRHKGRAEDPRPWLRRSSAHVAATGARDAR